MRMKLKEMEWNEMEGNGNIEWNELEWNEVIDDWVKWEGSELKGEMKLMK